MDLNSEYMEDIKIVHTADNTLDIEKSIRNLIQLRNRIMQQYPEYIDSITDIDFALASAAYRINNVDLLETTIQKHYYNDQRFKRLYQNFRDVETANVWNNVIDRNARNMERTFIRSLSIVILTGICLTVILRK